VAFISDDWGDLRVRNQEDYQNLVEAGIPVNKSLHTKVETLANQDDLNALFEVLTSVKDLNGRHAVLSPFTIMANPDFEKVKESDFAEYFYTPFPELLDAYGDKTKTMYGWKEGIESGIFLPELHGREHINVPLWLRKLQEKDEEYLTCFRYRYAHHSNENMKIPMVAAYNFQSEEDFHFIDSSIRDASEIFFQTFGYKPRVFNPPNAIFHSRFYPSLKASGVIGTDTGHYRTEPDGKGGFEKKSNRYGQISKEGIVHFISNCAFEPVKGKQGVVEDTLKQVEAAFRWNKPAIINTHRINYVMGRGDHRDRCLSELRSLLHELVKRWPDIKFMGMGEFAGLMEDSLESRSMSK
jgi:hypothetical protein